MSRIPQVLALLIVGLSTIWPAGQVAAGDHFRKLGIGYGAGYHAPATSGTSATCEKLHSYHHWKNACCHPGPTAPPCGCAPCGAPPTCAPPCLTPKRGWSGNMTGAMNYRPTPAPALN